MKNWIKDTLGVVVAVTACVLFVFLIVSSTTVTDMYTIKNPTQEQVETLVRGDPSNRIWFDDATQLYQGSSLIKISLRARYFESDRIPEFLNEVGVEYELIKTGR